MKKAFGRKDRHSASLKGANLSQQRPLKLVGVIRPCSVPHLIPYHGYVLSARADAFEAKDSEELAVWFKSIGLDMYCDLVQEKMLTGESLAEIAGENSSHQLVVSSPFRMF